MKAIAKNNFLKYKHFKSVHCQVRFQYCIVEFQVDRANKALSNEMVVPFRGEYHRTHAQSNVPMVNNDSTSEDSAESDGRIFSSFPERIRNPQNNSFAHSLHCNRLFSLPSARDLHCLLKLSTTMSLFPYTPRSYYYSPLERSLARMMDECERPFRWIAPYWIEIPDVQQCNIGNTLGNVIDDKEKFAVQVDVTQFRPNELTVNVRDRELVVEGHHEERSDGSGKIERHFIRKYTLPEDAQLDTLESHLSDKGVLSVCAKKSAVGGPPSRTIPIQAAPRENMKKTENPKK
ncbi:Small heat shock protein OV25-1 [Toxocara canis]|uniref:Small heat shock protein OV25-1 n=1 Tax=Toxocara canis TaxID=6265 RepID=A0A0B2V088_TOXCA|nr:Small heat shock protein OV25-1 [Toxocara canis]